MSFKTNYNRNRRYFILTFENSYLGQECYPDPNDYILTLDTKDKYGHSWWKLEITPTTAVDLIKLTDQNLIVDVNSLPDRYTDRCVPISQRYPAVPECYLGQAGWWPDVYHVDSILFHVGWIEDADGKTMFGSNGHTASGVHEWQIQYSDLISALYLVKGLVYITDDWNVWFNNCTDQAILVGEEPGISTIWSWGPLTSPAALSNHLNGL